MDLHQVEAYLMANFKAISYWTVLHQANIITYAELLEVELDLPIVALNDVSLSIFLIARGVESESKRLAQAYLSLNGCLDARYGEPIRVALTPLELIDELCVRQHSNIMLLIICLLLFESYDDGVFILHLAR